MEPWQRIAHAEAQAHAGFGTSERFGPLVAAFVAPGLPLNTAWHDGTRVPDTAELAAFEAFSAAHAVPATLHVLSPAVPGLLPLLRERAYALEYVLHLYTHTLQTLPPVTLPVQEEPDADAWAAVSAQGFGPGSEDIMRVVAHAPGTRRFVARPGGVPAGSGALGVNGAVGALYGMSTLPDARNRGVQAALIAARLHAAQAAGATVATVFTTPGTGSERNVVRAGFTLGGMRLTFTRSISTR
ncbi:MULTISPECIES: GNAT family N-acetyltransferase [Deinococcus]|uniref:GNAT family N-acetyltransferase n=1 Tax=Deinococcus rufus TaxID=2136097 RepID=A0ABV7Z5I8_9DEIO|nr:GNAT family N-acetyltransferase [Deinococcus sp. AB2017081]WQE96577.1 GNAT family N-acetyltransferase [Deinococcus sp. AB2017081]